MTRAPVIGITLDSEEAGGYAASPWYALRQNYAEAVTAAGGLPVLLPHQPEREEDYLDLIDWLVITGGAFDIDPALFGAAECHPTVVLKRRRTAFELALLKGAMARDKAVLGICGGQQLLNVAQGGTLIQHIPDEVPGALAHEHSPTGHMIDLVPGTKLASIAGRPRISVNSSHHQSVKAVAPGCIVNALAPDGVIEGIEVVGARFHIGVQWHPEYGIDGVDTALFRALIEASR